MRPEVAAVWMGANAIGVVAAASASDPDTEIEQETPSPVVVVGASADHFDPARVRATLLAVPYKDCGSRGELTLLITFAPNGIVHDVVVEEDEASSVDVTACVRARFFATKIAPFNGDARTVRFRVRVAAAATATAM